MANSVASKRTGIPSEEVITRAVQFFATANWRPTSQSARAATFEGRAPIPWFMLLFAVVGFIACVVPGIIFYIVAIKKVRKFVNLIVTATPAEGGTDVTVTYPSQAKKLAVRFMAALPN